MGHNETHLSNSIQLVSTFKTFKTKLKKETVKLGLQLKQQRIRFTSFSQDMFSS